MKKKTLVGLKVHVFGLEHELKRLKKTNQELDAAVKGLTTGTCKWLEDGKKFYFYTRCGQRWSLRDNEDEVSRNAIFCPKCGGKIKRSYDAEVYRNKALRKYKKARKSSLQVQENKAKAVIK